MAAQTEQVAHKDLVEGTETDLHSHAGGGSGGNIDGGDASSIYGGSEVIDGGSA